MKKDLLTFFGIFFTVLFASTGAFAQESVIVKQAGDIIDRLKPIVFVGAAIYMVWIGVNAVIGGDEAKGAKMWEKIGSLALALGVFLVAGAIVNLFIPDAGVDFLNQAQ